MLKLLTGQHKDSITAFQYVTSLQREGDDGVITASEDRSMLVWLLRDNGEYWPSVHKDLGAVATVINYLKESNRIIVGLTNGLISIFNCSEDWNGISVQKTFQAHDGRVSDMVSDGATGIIITCGRDKKVKLFSSDTGAALADYTLNSAAVSLQYSAVAKIVFVGDGSGNIHMLKVQNKSEFKLVTELTGHRGSITALLWEPAKEFLFSSGADKVLVAWDIGGAKGDRYEMRGMRHKCKGFSYDRSTETLLAVEDKFIFAWDMTKGRKTNPVWKDSNDCQICSAPFLWNVSKMWEEKKLDLNRQHHCRACGKAVCEACCSKERSLLATMGHETKVRLCKQCFPKITDAERCRRCKVIECGTKNGLVSFATASGKPIMVSSGPENSIRIYGIQKEVLEATGMNMEAYREKTSLKAQATNVLGGMSFASLMGTQGVGDEDFDDDDDEDEDRAASATVYKLGGDDDSEDEAPKAQNLYLATTEDHDPDDPDADMSSPFS